LSPLALSLFIDAPPLLLRSIRSDRSRELRSRGLRSERLRSKSLRHDGGLNIALVYQNQAKMEEYIQPCYLTIK
jgi:hypothetical protein